MYICAEENSEDEIDLHSLDARENKAWNSIRLVVLIIALRVGCFDLCYGKFLFCFCFGGPVGRGSAGVQVTWCLMQSQ